MNFLLLQFRRRGCSRSTLVLQSRRIPTATPLALMPEECQSIILFWNKTCGDSLKCVCFSLVPSGVPQCAEKGFALQTGNFLREKVGGRMELGCGDEETEVSEH